MYHRSQIFQVIVYQIDKVSRTTCLLHAQRGSFLIKYPAKYMSVYAYLCIRVTFLYNRINNRYTCIMSAKSLIVSPGNMLTIMLFANFMYVSSAAMACRMIFMNLKGRGPWNRLFLMSVNLIPPYYLYPDYKDRHDFFLLFSKRIFNKIIFPTFYEICPLL